MRKDSDTKDSFKDFQFFSGESFTTSLSEKVIRYTYSVELLRKKQSPHMMICSIFRLRESAKIGQFLKHIDVWCAIILTRRIHSMTSNFFEGEFWWALFHESQQNHKACYFVVKKQSLHMMISLLSVCGTKTFLKRGRVGTATWYFRNCKASSKRRKKEIYWLKQVYWKRCNSNFLKIYILEIFLPLIFTNNATGREKMTDEREANFFLKKLILDFELLWYDQLHR